MPLNYYYPLLIISKILFEIMIFLKTIIKYYSKKKKNVKLNITRHYYVYVYKKMKLFQLIITLFVRSTWFIVINIYHT